MVRRMGIRLAARLVGRLHQLLATLRPICSGRRWTAGTHWPVGVMDARSPHTPTTTIVAPTK